MRRLLVALAAVGAVGGALAATPAPEALGAAPAPSFRIDSIAAPTSFSAADNALCLKPATTNVPASCDSYIITVTNSGSIPSDGTPVTITDTLPTGLTAERIITQEHQAFGNGSFQCSTELVRCVYQGTLQPDGVLVLFVWLKVESTVLGSVTNSVTVSGGGTSSPAIANFHNTVSPSPAEAPAGLSEFTLGLDGPDGAPDGQAGDHPYETTSTLSFGTRLLPDIAKQSAEIRAQSTNGRKISPVQDVKDVVVDLPPGFVGNVQEAAQCSESELAPEGVQSGTSRCPPNSEIGVILLNEAGKIGPSLTEALIYNMSPEHGYPAEFGFNFLGHPIILFASAVPSTTAAGGYVLRVSAKGIPRVIGLGGIALSFWGVPAAASHDDMRADAKGDFGLKSGIVPVAFLTNPVDCSAGPLRATAMSDAWESPGRWSADGSPDLSDPAWRTQSTVLYPAITGCDLLQFNPALEVSPETTRVDSPSGVTVDLRIPQAEQVPPLLTTPEVKNVTVTLPSGMAVSPAAADGLQGCAPAQIDLVSAAPGACPDASVLGSVRVVTPLLPAPLEGQIYLATPACDPCTNADAADGRMMRLYLEAQGSGVVVKKQGTVYANTATGQLTTAFTNDPQVPFSDLQVHFKAGLRAALATPQSCGEFTSTSDLTPWSSPITPDAAPRSPFDVSWDGDGGACPATTPFAPAFEAGTSNPNAGQLSPLTVTLHREDREQDMAGLQVTMPPGLLGKLAGVPLCGEPAADLGTCSSSSQIGRVTVAAGPGGHPFYETGQVYLTGPYRGSPFGLSIVTPTIAGPFNLGDVVVRAQVGVDPHTAALTVTSDPLPQIIDGVPLRLRLVNVTVDRPGFIFNPTSCAPQRVTATISGAQGMVAHESVPFAVSGCAGLAFGPRLSVFTSGKTSRRTGASLDARLTWPKGPQSNVAMVKVSLPRQLPSRLSTLQHACPDGTFNLDPAACPPESLIGAARVITPVLPLQPFRPVCPSRRRCPKVSPASLVGPVYFVSHGGSRFPDLVAILQGYGVRVDLVGETFISKRGVTSSTFRHVPDVPVSSFELYLPQGPHSALGANRRLCASKLVMPTSFVAQDGARLTRSTSIEVTGCTKAKGKAAIKRVGRATRSLSHKGKSG